MFKLMSQQTPLTIALKTLDAMLSLKRPHGGKGVTKAVAYLRKQHPSATVDVCGNVHLDLRGLPDLPLLAALECQSPQETQLRDGLITRPPKPHRTLFVAHLDTVHRKDGANRFTVSGDKLTAKGAVLGADDGAGIAILMALIHAKVPAYYVFTQGEEVGGVGAKYLRRHSPTLLAQFDRAVAFDRRSTISVISHQGMGRCCSDLFANALSDGLNGLGMMMQPDDSGLYTDTAEWTDIIAECTNISCGYFNEHTKDEWLDLNHFGDLVNAVVQLDWDALPVVRNPKDLDEHDDWWWSRSRASRRALGAKGSLAGYTAQSSPQSMGQLNRLVSRSEVLNACAQSVVLDDGWFDDDGLWEGDHWDRGDASSGFERFSELEDLGSREADVIADVDAQCYRMMQAIEAAEDGDDFSLKQLMLDATSPHSRNLIAEMLYPLAITPDALDYGFEMLGFMDTREVLLGMLALTDASLV